MKIISSSLLAVAVLLAITVSLSFDDVFALKSEGVSMPKYGSETKGIVCGDMLCSEIPGGYEAWKQQGKVTTTEPKAEMENKEEENETKEAMPQPPPTASMTKLSDNVYHYFGGFYSSLVVMSPTDVLITDPANDMRAQMLKEEIAKITDTPVTKIVLTHEHYDHVGGTGVFEDAEIICHSNCQAVFDLDPFGASPATVHTTFDDFLSMDIGDTTVEMHHFGPGDGEATTIIYLPKEQIIVSADLYGDQALTPTRWMDDKNYVGVHKILNEIKTWQIQHEISGHSPTTDPASLHQGTEFVNDLYDAVFSEITSTVQKDGPSAVLDLALTLPQTLTLEKYSDWEGYDEHFSKHVDRMMLSMFHGD